MLGHMTHHKTSTGLIIGGIILTVLGILGNIGNPLLFSPEAWNTNPAYMLGSSILMIAGVAILVSGLALRQRSRAIQAEGGDVQL